MSKTLSRKILFMAAIWLSSFMTLSLTSCSDSSSDEPDGPGGNSDTGVISPSWTDDQPIEAAGQELTLTFNATNRWNVINQSTWLTVSPTTGNSGNSSIKVTAEANTTGKERSTTIVIRVTGAAKACTVKFTQEASSDQPVAGVNGWIRSYMESHYLWNEPIPALKINASLSAQNYLKAILDGVDAADHLNREDGHWANGSREYYYSYIESSNGRSRSGDQATGSGVMFMSATLLSGNNVGLIIELVCPGSPAAQAGLKRSYLVSAIDGTNITTGNYQSMANKLVNGNINITYHQPVFGSEGGVSLGSAKSLQLSSATFDNVSVYMSKVLQLSSGKKVGYLLYDSFDYGYDDQLIQAFAGFKAQGITDLIVDLRYNGGGHVISSLLMGTLIAGNTHKGKVYGRTTYNATRSATTPAGEYKLGIASVPEMPTGYNKITEGLASCVDLNTIYVICTENTASASELVINGLRGLDVTVNLIGTTTNGKNCGMEGISKAFGGITYEFYPITFYIENAKGFKDYSNGFTPDVVCDDEEYYPGDFGTTDDALSALALTWINSGNKPSVAAMRSRASSIRTMPLQLSAKRRIKGAMVLPHE